MPFSTPSLLLFTILLSLGGPNRPLRVEDFIARGYTYLTTDNCLRLTDAQSYLAGSIWNKQPVNLTRPFTFKMSIRTGCKDTEGADGMVFVMKQGANQTGYRGEGIGFAGLVPSMGIEIDTYQNRHLNDPAEDHIAIMFNGQVGHFSNLDTPKRIPNIEDCKRHEFVVRWNPGTNRLSVELDQKEVIFANIDLIKHVFGSSSDIYWGITAATGRLNNIQEVCFQSFNKTSPTIRGNGKGQ